MIRAIAKKSKLSPIVEAVEQSGLPDLLSGKDDDLQSNAENGMPKADEKASTDLTKECEESEPKVDKSPPTAEEQLRDMVNALKQN